jgi:hypothetical protein
MQAIQSGFYLLHDKFFEIISKIFGPSTLQRSIEHKTVVEFLTANKIWCVIFVIHQGKFLTCCICVYKCDAIFRGLLLNVKNFSVKLSKKDQFTSFFSDFLCQATKQQHKHLLTPFFENFDFDGQKNRKFRFFLKVR